MSDVLIGLAIGAGSLIAVVVLGFILLRSSLSQTERARARLDKRDDEHEKRVELLVTDRDTARENEKILHDNQRELLRELGILKTEHAQQAAKLAAAEKHADDLERILADHPGALADALHVAARRLRDALTAREAMPAGPAGADPDRGEEGPVHGPGTDLERP